MFHLLKAFLFKIVKDVSVRVTLIISAALSIFFMVLLLLLDRNQTDPASRICTGQTMMLLSLSPVFGFAIMIPVSLVSFVVSEFSQGIIRNKIIVGNSKLKVYLSLVISCVLYSVVIFSFFVAFSILLGTICNGFNSNGIAVLGLVNWQMGFVTPNYLVRAFVLAIFVQIFVASLTVFLTSLFRAVGPCIPIIIIGLFVMTLLSFLLPMSKPEAIPGLRTFVPLYGLMDPDKTQVSPDVWIFIFGLGDEKFNSALLSASAYFLIFGAVGSVIFIRRDLK